MKSLLLLTLLTGCSLIRINEAPQPPKHRPEMLTVTEYACHDLSDKICQEDFEIVISRSHIAEYYEHNNVCMVVLDSSRYSISMLKMTCSEFGQLLNQ